MLGISRRFGRIVFVTILGWAGVASADVFNMSPGQTSLSLVPVGNPGNPADTLVMINDGTTGYGSVGYNYNISKFETTIGQYTAFLNAVAKTDTYGLYNGSMAADPNVAGILRGGSSGNYTYSTLGSPNRPVAYVNWGDAARFANWLTNGQPTGSQNLNTTEDGSYFINGAMASIDLSGVTRKANARFVLPSENEWYKAAYYDPTKGGSNYWQYAMRTDAVPYSDQAPGSDTPNPAFAANFLKDDALPNGYNDGYAVTGSTSVPSGNALTDVGAYNLALSYYGTFDQNGNVLEWNELLKGGFRGAFGGRWNSPEINMGAFARIAGPQTFEHNINGFRIAEVPEPTSCLLVLVLLPLVRRRRTPSTAACPLFHPGVFRERSQQRNPMAVKNRRGPLLRSRNNPQVRPGRLPAAGVLLFSILI